MVCAANLSYAALQLNHDLQFSHTVYGLGSGEPLYFNDQFTLSFAFLLALLTLHLQARALAIGQKAVAGYQGCFSLVTWCFKFRRHTSVQGMSVSIISNWQFEIAMRGAVSVQGIIEIRML